MNEGKFKGRQVFFITFAVYFKAVGATAGAKGNRKEPSMGRALRSSVQIAWEKGPPRGEGSMESVPGDGVELGRGQGSEEAHAADVVVDGALGS